MTIAVIFVVLVLLLFTGVPIFAGLTLFGGALLAATQGGLGSISEIIYGELNRYLLVANASNADKIRDWLRRHASGFKVELADRQTSTCMLAVQGPQALERLARVLDAEFVRSLKPRACAETAWQGVSVFASRTGYTGEDGLELVASAEAGPSLWRALVDAGVRPCGLGARDTLRL